MKKMIILGTFLVVIAAIVTIVAITRNKTSVKKDQNMRENANTNSENENVGISNEIEEEEDVLVEVEGQFVDEECGVKISQCLTHEKGTSKNDEKYSLQFRVKDGCEQELVDLLDSEFIDQLAEDDTVLIGDSSMAKQIKKGTKKYLYSFFKSGKEVKSIEVCICIVDVEGQWYCFVYTV